MTLFHRLFLLTGFLGLSACSTANTPSPNAQPSRVVIDQSDQPDSPSPSASPSITASARPVIVPNPTPTPYTTIEAAAPVLDLVSGSPTALRFQIAGTLGLKPREQLCLQVIPVNDQRQPLSPGALKLDWSSSESAVAEVDLKGCVRALSPGSAKILARDAAGLEAGIELRVAAADAPPAQRQVFDFNGDGQRDWLIGTGRRYRLYLGEGESFKPEAARPERLVGFQFPNVPGTEAKAAFASVTATGDLNGDGLDDIAFGHAFSGNLGEISVIFGSRHPQSYYSLKTPGISLKPLNGIIRDGVFVQPPAGQNVQQLGRQVLVQDLDRDGLADLITGNSGYEGNGAVQVFKGRSIWPAKLNSQEASFNLIGDPSDDRRSGGAQFGAGLATGDFNGDKAPDLAVVGTSYAVIGPYDDKGGKQVIDVGKTFVFLGGKEVWRTQKSSEAAIKIQGTVRPDYAEFLQGGIAVRDLDGDGRDELLLQTARRTVDPVQWLNPATEQLQDVIHFYNHVYAFSGLAAGQNLGLPQAGLAIDSLGEGHGQLLLLGDLNQDGKTDLSVGQEFTFERSGLAFFDGQSLRAGTAPTPSGTLLISETRAQPWPGLVIAELDAKRGPELFLTDPARPEALCIARPQLSGDSTLAGLSGFVCVP